jgi:hypothetical protein
MIVEVSSTKVKWPQVCACCCGHANGTCRISHEGVLPQAREPSGEQHYWDVPYCATCLSHARLAEQADQLRERTALGPLGVLCGVALAVTGAALIGATFLFMPERNPALMAASGAVVFASLGGFSFDVLRQRRRGRSERQQLLHQAEAASTLGCQSMHWAVRFDGSFGRVHVFIFQNETYAAAFMSTNRDKCVQQFALNKGA